MNKQILSIYKNYLLGNYNREKFLSMREAIGRMTDSELETLMLESWNSEIPFPKMPVQAKQQIKTNLSKYINPQKHRTIRATWLNVAAAAVILLLSAATIYLLAGRNAQMDATPLIVNIDSGQKATVRLPDNTNVHLNAGTRLEYETSNTDQRKVYLSGEAYFEVAHNRHRPFIVDVGDLQIEVLGTSFNVQTYSDDDYIETSLIEGSVKLHGTRLDSTYFLEPMQQFKYSRKDGTMQIVPFDSGQELGWMSDRLVFNSEPLYKVINRIGRWYGVKIQLQRPELGNDLITGTYNNEELTDVLQSISIQYKVKYKIKGKEVTIY